MRRRRDFLRARDGRKAVRPSLVLQAVSGPDAHGPARAGFTATKKIGNAVRRNRAKRRLREAARLLLPLHGAPGTDYVFIARAATGGREWAALLDDVKSALVSLAPADPPARAPRAGDAV
ncbi:ribonuclease P protein component [Glycocaulis profundi]|nr:ribonuclease P protein component [Glycocaulis profundi]